MAEDNKPLGGIKYSIIDIQARRMQGTYEVLSGRKVSGSSNDGNVLSGIEVSGSSNDGKVSGSSNDGTVTILHTI